MNMYVNAGFVS